MEYKQAYWDETEDHYLIERHEREIFPLLKRRYLFSEVENFILYDLVGPDGHVIEDVFAFTNRFGDERALVLCNNRYDRSNGWIKYSSASSEKNGGSFRQFTLGEGLTLSPAATNYTIFRDQVTNLEYIRNNDDLLFHGLYVELDGFKYHVFLDFREIQDNEYGHYSQLAAYLGGRGVPSIDVALKETFLTPVYEPFSGLITPEFLEKIKRSMSSTTKDNEKTKILDYFNSNLSEFLIQVKNYTSAKSDEKNILKEQTLNFKHLLNLPNLTSYLGLRSSAPFKSATDFLRSDAPIPATLLIWIIVSKLGKLQDEAYAAMISLAWIDEFLLGRLIEQSLLDTGIDEYSAGRQLLLIKALTILPNWLEQASKNSIIALETLFEYPEIQHFLGVNRYQDVLYFHFESFRELMAAFYTTSVITLLNNKNLEKTTIKKTILEWFKIIEKLIITAQKNGSRVYETIESFGAGK
jgi:hypothetical protein